MKTDVETLRDTFQIGDQVYDESRLKAREAWDMYHNRQYTESQIRTLKQRGQPVETFNIIKLFTRVLSGYYSTVLTTIKVSPRNFRDITTAALLNDVVTYVLEDNDFRKLKGLIEIGAMISGIFSYYITVKNTEEVDEFGRPEREINIEYVNDAELVLDPLSRAVNYSDDARFIHRFKWLPEEQVKKMYGKKKLKELESYYNFLEIDSSEFTTTYNKEFQGKYRYYDNYLVVHSVVKGDDGRTWSIHWSDGIILNKEELTFNEVSFPYRIQKVTYSNKAEYYGIFNEVTETQKAINQALIRIQLLVNTHKALVEKHAVDNINEFTDAFNRVASVIEVKSLTGINIQDMSIDILQQYALIDKGFDRIQRVLNISDSFLGSAFASDSGRKVKIQQNATISALNYFTESMAQFYTYLGWDIANLVKQYFTANQVLKVPDDIVGDRWVALNQPETVPTGDVDPETGQPVEDFVYEEVIDPDTNEPLQDSDGDLIIAPIPIEETEVAFTKFEVKVESVNYNDEDEKTQLMLETIMSGPVGQVLAQNNLAGFLKVAGLSLRNMKTKYAHEISDIYSQTADMVTQPEQTEDVNAAFKGGQPMSPDLKLPQNTNEGA